jgi:hypothetical protein
VFAIVVAPTRASISISTEISTTATIYTAVAVAVAVRGRRGPGSVLGGVLAIPTGAIPTAEERDAATVEGLEGVPVPRLENTQE